MEGYSGRRPTGRIYHCLENTRRQATLSGFSFASIDSALRDLAALLHYLLVEYKTSVEILTERPELQAFLNQIAPEGRLYERNVRFWSQLASRNMPDYWSKVNACVLTLCGRHDFLSTEADHPLIARIVKSASTDRAQCIVLENYDHAFRNTTSIEDSFRRWNSPGVEFNPQIIRILKEWTDALR